VKKKHSFSTIFILIIVLSTIFCFIHCLAKKNDDENDELLDLLGSSLATSNQRSSQSSQTTENFQIGGSISGLSGVVYLQNNLAERFPFNVNGNFVFPQSYENGSTFSITVYESPISQTCQVTNGFGVIDRSDKRDIIVVCN